MRLTLIDLSSLAYPIWHMAGSDPNPNAVADQLVARVRALGDEHTAICCDSGKSFRNEIASYYKANRKPEERATLYHQIDLALDKLKADGFPVWAAKGFEADDVIASAANRAVEDEHEVLVISADKDLLQLICDQEPGRPGVSVKSIKTGDVLDEAAVVARYGILPSQMRDYLTIVGDVSDNIVGVVGIGEKGAAALLQAHGTLDAIYAQLDALGHEKKIKPSQVLALRAFESRLSEVRQLITLRTDVEIPFGEILIPRTPKDVPPMVPPAELNEAPMVEPDPRPAAPVVSRPAMLTVVPTPPPTPIDVYGPVAFKSQLEPSNMSEATFLANRAFESKLFGGYGTAQAILMALLAGRELGLTAMASLRGIHVIEGKPTMSADLMRALVIRSGAVRYFRCIERTDERSTWEAQRDDDPPVRVTFTMEDAHKAGLVKAGSGWVKFPADMLVARASSKLARLVCPDILHGIYTPEELREAA